MMDLDLKIDPLKIQIEILEIDERLPSFKVRLDINIFHSTGKFNYSASDIWFECLKWDDFTDGIALVKGDDGFIVLGSMSDEFILKLSGNIIEISIHEISFDGFVVALNHSQRLTPDEISILKNSFLRLDRWW